MSIRNASAFATAYVEGYKGLPSNNPYPLGSGPWCHYEEHYNEGDADRRAMIWRAMMLAKEEADRRAGK